LRGCYSARFGDNSDGKNLIAAELVILDGSPLLDIKPYCPMFDHFKVSRFGWLQRPGRTDVADNRFYDDQPKGNEK